MGSGGPRGLQILRSGACVRGGFDSHAFPPFPAAARALLAAGLLIAALAAPAAAQVAPADTAARVTPAERAARADSIVPPAPVPAADTTARRGAPKHGWSDQPRFVMLRSAVVPGWGQAYNHAWLKAVAVAGLETWLLSALVHDNNVLNDIQAQLDTTPSTEGVLRNDLATAYNARLDQFVNRQWLLGGLLTYALVDAYVDAHFRNFDLEFRQDPALPDPAADPGPASAATGGRDGTTRLALEWHF